MSQYNSFIFEDYSFDLANKSLKLHYGYDNELHFTESYSFDFPFADNIDPLAIERAVMNLFFMAGVSYYKMYLSPTIVISKGAMTEMDAAFYSKTYQKGLGELFYVNQLDPNTPINFPVTAVDQPEVATNGSGMLVGIGGGKDSLVSVELLRAAQPTMTTWSLGHRPQLTPLVERIGLPHAWATRQWDRQILEHNDKGAYNGHVPISAILACVATLVSILSGTQDVVVSNEQSANEPTLEYRGVSVNHQYSKSQEFEQDYQALLQRHFGESQRYYSLLRPLNELAIAELFARIGFDKYHDVFSSCNRAFTHQSDHMFWDGTCPKCAFVFLALTPYVERQKLEAVFNSKNLLLDPELEVTYQNLLGIAGEKPLECIGTIAESRQAMQLSKLIYPELSKFEFEVNADQTPSSHQMPADVYQRLTSAISTI